VSVANLLNALLFQLNWFACVLGGAYGEPLWALITLSLMFAQTARGKTLRADVVLALSAAGIGLFLDSLWIFTGVLDYGSRFAPVWIVMMWMGAALSLNHSLAWLKPQPWLGGIMAAMVAPLCYLSGESLGAVTVDNAGLPVVALSWLLVFGFGLRFAGGLSKTSQSGDPRSS
jgi:hypothetical protein